MTFVMQPSLLTDIETFMADTGLSAHRTGILLARNGKLIDRLKAGGRIWPETEALIRKNLAAEAARRSGRRANPPKPAQEDAA